MLTIRGEWLALLMAGVFTAAVLALLAVVSATGPTQGAAAPAKSADAFVDSIGVNTHLMEGAGSGYADYAGVKGKLRDLGVRHVREMAFRDADPAYNREFYGKIKGLARIGIGTTLIVDPRWQNTDVVDREKIAWLHSQAGSSIEAFEGPNEFDCSERDGWAGFVRSYQQDLYRAVKGYGPTANVPVVGPSMCDAKSSDSVGDLSSHLDYGNAHSYHGGSPGQGDLESLWMPQARKISGSKPILATETGYHTDSSSASPFRGVSEAAQAKYAARVALYYFGKTGSDRIPRVYQFELADVPSQPGGFGRFGLLRADGSEKPAYSALENLVDLLEDPGAGPSFVPGSLDYSLSGDTSGIHNTLLQKRDGRFYLALWQEVESYDLSAGRDVPIDERPLTLNLAEGHGVKVYRSTDSTSPTYTSPGATLTVELRVPDHPLLVELTPEDAGSLPQLR